MSSELNVSIRKLCDVLVEGLKKCEDNPSAGYNIENHLCIYYKVNEETKWLFKIVRGETSGNGLYINSERILSRTTDNNDIDKLYRVAKEYITNYEEKQSIAKIDEFLKLVGDQN